MRKTLKWPWFVQQLHSRLLLKNKITKKNTCWIRYNKQTNKTEKSKINILKQRKLRITLTPYGSPLITS